MLRGSLKLLNMASKNLIKRFNLYQKERFPLAVLIFTTAAVILSSAAVAIPKGTNVFNNLSILIVSFITLILFMFHIRVLDEYKDYRFDSEFHGDRPVQKGLISLKELLILNVIGLFIQVAINLFISPTAFLFWLAAFAYTIIAGNEFFMGKWIKKKFFIYNLLNLLQLLFLQFYLYEMIEPSFSFRNELLTIHFIFVLFNVGVLEFGRKLKAKEEETEGRDTYSSRLGIKGASSVFMVICLIVYGLFVYMFFKIDGSTLLFLISIIALNIITFSTIYYLQVRTKKSSLILQGIAALFYIAMHLLLVFSKI